jgi:hypothetical protein
MAWSDAARAAAREARKAHRRIKLGGWDSLNGKGVKYPSPSSFSRSNIARSVKLYRALARGTATKSMLKGEGKIARPPKGLRLGGARGMRAWNSFAASGYRKWK